MNKKQLCASVAMIAVLATPAAAEEVELEEISVTANRVAVPTSSLGSSVTVITAEELERKQVRYVADALRAVPGLAVSQTGGPGRATAVRMRGMETGHTLVLVNGVEVADLSAAQPSYDFGHMLVTGIERIEVVRGPQSTLYGSDAIGGVINIITKQGEGDPTFSALAEYGSFNTKVLGTGVSGSTERFTYALDMTHNQTEGFSAANDANGNTEDDGYRNTTLNGRFTAQATENLSFNATLRVMNSHVEYDDWNNGQAVDDDDNMRKEERSLKLGSDWTVFDGALVNSFSAARSTSKRDIFNGKTQASFFDGAKDKYDYQGVWQMVDQHNLVFGAETEREHAETSGPIDETLWHKAAFVDYQGSLLDQSLYYTLGGRVDEHDQFGEHYTYRATVAYFLEQTDTRFHASYGTGFRAPSLFEQFDPTWGNPDLDPEEVRGWDAGVEQMFFDDRLTVDVTYFNNRTKNLIQWNNGYNNVSSSRAFGLETSVTADITEDLELSAGYTYTQARNNATGRMLARRPHHEGTANLTWFPMDGLSTGFDVRAVGSNFDSATGNDNGGYAVYGLKATYEVNETVSVYGRIENLTDKEYEEVDTYGTAGRSGYLGVKVIF